MKQNPRKVFHDGVLVDSQKTFINELSDLESCNYIQVFSHYGKTFWMVKLKHLNNGRCLVLACYPDYGYLREEGRLLKQWPQNKIPF